MSAEFPSNAQSVDTLSLVIGEGACSSSASIEQPLATITKNTSVTPTIATRSFSKFIIGPFSVTRQSDAMTDMPSFYIGTVMLY